MSSASGRCHRSRSHRRSRRSRRWLWSSRTLIAFAAQLVILADVALGAGGAVFFLHALRALVALLAPVGRVSKAHTAVVTMGFNPALVVTVNGAEQAVTHIIAAKMVVVAVRTIEAVVVVVLKGVGMKLQTRHQREQHHKHQQDADDAPSCVRFCHTIISSLKIILKICLCVLCCLIYTLSMTEAK